VIGSVEGVELSCVVGIPDPVAAYLTAAVFVRKTGFDDLTEDKVMQVVSKKLPSRKHILGGVYMVDQLPLTVNGKIKKNKVLEIAIEMRNSRLVP
jgi:acyl-coenzyme A synthetase/AMP-(fatty) acid ligase